MSVDWLILFILLVPTVLATINVASRILNPKELSFEIRDDVIYVTDLKRSGHGYTTHSFNANNVKEIHYDTDGVSYVQTIDGRQTQLGGEIMIFWNEIETAVKQDFPHISVTKE